MDFYDFISHEDTMSWAGEGNDVWGWVSPDGREFAALGQADGTAFMEVTKQGKLVFLGRLPQQSVISIWRDMKMVGDNMVIGTEVSSLTRSKHAFGIQLTKGRLLMEDCKFFPCPSCLTLTRRTLLTSLPRTTLWDSTTVSLLAARTTSLPSKSCRW